MLSVHNHWTYEQYVQRAQFMLKEDIDVNKWYQWFPCVALNIKQETCWLFLKKQLAFFKQ